MCSRFQLKMPATHFPGLNSGTGLALFVVRNPLEQAHKCILGWLSSWGSKNGEQVVQIPVGRLHEEKGPGQLLSETISVSLTESGVGIWKVNFGPMG